MIGTAALAASAAIKSEDEFMKAISHLPVEKQIEILTQRVEMNRASREIDAHYRPMHGYCSSGWWDGFIFGGLLF